MSDDDATAPASAEPTEDQIREAYDQLKAHATDNGGHYPYFSGCLLAHVQLIAGYHEGGNGEWLAEAIGRALATVRAEARLTAEQAAERDTAVSALLLTAVTS